MWGGALGGVISTELLVWFGQSAFVRQSTSLTMSEGALQRLFENVSESISTGEEMGIKNLAIMVGSELYAQYQEAYIIGYALSILVIVALCLLAAALIFRGIRATLKFKPEDTPLTD